MTWMKTLFSLWFSFLYIHTHKKEKRLSNLQIYIQTVKPDEKCLKKTHEDLQWDPRWEKKFLLHTRKLGRQNLGSPCRHGLTCWGFLLMVKQFSGCPLVLKNFPIFHEGAMKIRQIKIRRISVFIKFMIHWISDFKNLQFEKIRFVKSPVWRKG